MNARTTEHWSASSRSTGASTCCTGAQADDRVPARHHRGRGRLHLDGARGDDARGPLDRAGGAQRRRHRHLPGRAAGAPRRDPSADGQDPGLSDRLLVLDPEQMQTYATRYDPSRSGEMPVPISSLRPDPLTDKRVIARRSRVRAALGRRRQSGRRRVGDDPECRRRGRHRRGDHADRRGRRRRRRAGSCPRIRLRGEPARDHRPAVPVRFL